MNHRATSRRHPRGIALMEVIAALTIFVIAAMFVLSGFVSAQRGVVRAKLEADAADLAVSVLSDVQMRTVPIDNEPPTDVDPTLFPGWTYEIIVNEIQDLPDLSTLKQVNIIIRNDDARFMHQTSQIIWDKASGEQEEGA